MSAGDADEAHTAPGTQRLDKWLWFARFTKTRTLAAAIVAAGKTRINRVRVDKPAQTVRAGAFIWCAFWGLPNDGALLPRLVLCMRN